METARVLEELVAAGAVPEGGRVRPHPEDPERRLVPVVDDHESPFPSIEVEVGPPAPRSFRDHLSEETLAMIDPPTRHEILGDIVLIKLDETQRAYGEEIGEALLAQHPRLRAAFEDRGVFGPFRVRELETLAVRPGMDDSTRTRITESRSRIWIDPANVYFSGRLSREREGTLATARELRERLGRPIDVCDPFAGVGPSLVPLLSEVDLVGRVWASDLNPDAIALLRENLTGAGVEIECADALELAGREDMRGAFDLLLVNLPHDAVRMLADLLPMVRRPGRVRGWAVVDQDRMDATRDQLEALLADLSFEIRRSYAAEADLCRFEGKPR